MAQFTVTDGTSGQPMLYIEAESDTATPTEITAADSAWEEQAQYANEMIALMDGDASVQFIASRMGPYASLHEGHLTEKVDTDVQA